jgi:hypothetical protein
MLIEIQFPEASECLRQLLNELPSDRRAAMAGKVDRIASELHHPTLGGAVVLSVGLDGTLEASSGLRGVVLPLERTEVT